MEKLSAYILPAVVIFIIGFGIYKKINVFECFLDGAKKGIETFISLISPILALILMVGMLSASGGLALITKLLSPVAALLGIPLEVIPLCLLSPLSGSGSLSVFENILKTCGANSLAGRTASVIAGSTETTFYAITVYYGAVGIKKTRHTVAASLCADLASFVVSAWAVKFFMGT